MVFDILICHRLYRIQLQLFTSLFNNFYFSYDNDCKL